ncbi:MAG: LysE family translocator [Gammaproteobacteria bacterium]|nr:MAG: LysE family translocator [Gammaproteobacteria bacterium]
MTVEAWLLFCLIEAVLCLQPGPSALVVMSLATSGGRAKGIEATAGVIVANAAYFIAAATGLIAVHMLSLEMFTLIKWTGAAYLIWLGGRAIWLSFQPVRNLATTADSTKRPFWRGLVVQGANPNLLVYFGAILPQFVDPNSAIAPQVAILAVSSFVIEFSILSGYSVLLGELGRRALANYRVHVDRLGGILLIAAAAGIASLSRA